MTFPVLQPRSDIESAWRAAYAAGRRAWADVDLAWAEFLPARVGLQPPCRPGDYYLARACDAGVDGAWERLEADLRRPLWSFLRARGASRADADALVDDAWGTLAAPPPSGGARTAIGTYDGRGSLRAWVATVVWRRLCDRWRSRAQAPPAGPEPDAIAVADDPAQRVADAETARALGDALEEAWPRLTRKELQAVVLKYRHALPQADIAGILKIGAPRVTRLLQSAMRRLRASIEARLGVGALGAGSADAWAEVGETVDRILARAAADVGDTASRRSVDG